MTETKTIGHDLSKFDDGDNPGAAALNLNVDKIDTRLLGIGDAFPTAYAVSGLFIKRGDNKIFENTGTDIAPIFTPRVQVTSADVLAAIAAAATPIDVNGQQIQNMADPTMPQHAATKAYVDAVVAVILGGGGAPHALTHEFGGLDPIPSLPLTSEKAALAGSFGLPGASNKYLTETDPDTVRISGRVGGQTIAGGKAAGESLILESTTHATKGAVRIRGTSVTAFVVEQTGGGNETFIVDTQNRRMGYTQIGAGFAPQRLVHLRQQGTEPFIRLESYSLSGSADWMIEAQRARGTLAAPQPLGNDDDIFGILATGAFDTSGAFSGTRGEFLVEAAGPWTPSSQGTRFVLKTNPQGSALTPINRLVVADQGTVIIGARQTNRAGERLLVQGDIDAESETADVQSFLTAAGAAISPFARTRRATGTLDSPGAVGNGDPIGEYGMTGHDGSAYGSEGAVALIAQATEAWNGSSHGAKGQIAITPNGAVARAIAAEFDDPADGDTALLIRRNVSATLTLERVSMGAVDSGGTGFKALRVPN